MTRKTILFQGDPVQFRVEGEGRSFVTTAVPVVTNDRYGTTAGLLRMTSYEFAYWHARKACDEVTAWRLTQLLSQLKVMRNNSSGYDATVIGLMIALTGDHNQDRLKNRAEDLGMTQEEFMEEILRIRQQWPSAEVLCALWDKLPVTAQDELVPGIIQAFDDGSLEADAKLRERIVVAKRRIQDVEVRKRREDQLIAAGLEREKSLRQFLEDIGVSNLEYSLSYENMGEPSHFDWSDLDWQLMRELIGSNASFSRIPLYTTERRTDDPLANRMIGGEGVSIVPLSSGRRFHPQIYIAGERKNLMAVEWSEEDEEFSVLVRPDGVGFLEGWSDDDRKGVSQLRSMIGDDTCLGRPLKVGESPSWAKKRGERTGKIHRLRFRR